MDLALANTVWEELKRYINKVERTEAAENLVSILVDNDFDPEDIRDEFKGDAEIKRALSSYLEKYEEEEEDEEDYDDEDYAADDDY